MAYYTRSQWGATEVPRWKYTSFVWPNPNGSTIHRVGVSSGLGFKDTYFETMRSIQEHAFSKGLVDFDYNFAVDEDGDVYEGRGAEVQSGAQHAGNSTSLAIVYLEPDFNKTFPEAAKRSIVDLNTLYAHGGPIHPHNYWNNGGKYDTSCPGSVIEDWCNAGAPVSGNGDFLMALDDKQQIELYENARAANAHAKKVRAYLQAFRDGYSPGVPMTFSEIGTELRKVTNAILHPPA